MIAVFGMLIITFRTAYLPTEDDKDVYKPVDNKVVSMTHNEEVRAESDSPQSLSSDDSSEEESYRNLAKNKHGRRDDKR